MQNEKNSGRIMSEKAIKILVKASHPTTPDNEALTALRIFGARVMKAGGLAAVIMHDDLEPWQDPLSFVIDRKEKEIARLSLALAEAEQRVADQARLRQHWHEKWKSASASQPKAGSKAKTLRRKGA